MLLSPVQCLLMTRLIVRLSFRLSLRICAWSGLGVGTASASEATQQCTRMAEQHRLQPCNTLWPMSMQHIARSCGPVVERDMLKPEARSVERCEDGSLYAGCVCRYHMCALFSEEHCCVQQRGMDCLFIALLIARCAGCHHSL